ncbi:DUF481 domain-containing protein [Nevskia ramosa]|uniref:DUF481 domain-containing protein n=1 Tax=Nevskia ramosa TaxID=64002 RepID=UPI003D1213CA
MPELHFPRALLLAITLLPMTPVSAKDAAKLAAEDGTSSIPPLVEPVAKLATPAEPAAEPAPAAPPPPVPTPWLGELAVGLVNASGNTSTRSINLRSALEYRTEHWGNRLTALAFSGSRDGVSTDERYSVANKTDYQFGFRDYLFGNLAYDNDRFAGIAERYSATVGYGRHVLRSKSQKLDIEIGVGANRTRDQDEIYETAAIGTLGGKYTWTISPNAEFTQTLRTEGGVTNVYVNPITALKLTIVGNLFATFNHEIRYNTEVPSETRHLDQITTINLGYSFGTPPA